MPHEDVTLKSSDVSLRIQAFGTLNMASILDSLAAFYADQSSQLAVLFISKRSTTEAAESLKAKFERLAAEWRRETRFVSVVRRKMAHPAYLKIIGMGKDALPFIFKDLDARPDDWIPALMSITEDNPVKPDDNFEQAVKAWLRWGREHNYL